VTCQPNRVPNGREPCPDILCRACSILRNRSCHTVVSCAEIHPPLGCARGHVHAPTQNQETLVSHHHLPGNSSPPHVAGGRAWRRIIRPSQTMPTTIRRRAFGQRSA
jgi:hypothetical protein